MADVESIKQKLERHERIILIVSESLPHLGANASIETRATNPTPTTPRRPLLSTSTNGGVSSTSSSSLSHTLTQSMSNNSNLNQLGSRSAGVSGGDPGGGVHSFSNDDHIKKLFATQLLTLKECNKQTHSELFKLYPNINIWLKLLNFSKSSIDAILNSSLNFHDLYEMTSEHELNNLFQSNGVHINENELNTLFNAFQNLKQCCSNLVAPSVSSTCPSAGTVYPSIATTPVSSTSTNNNTGPGQGQGGIHPELKQSSSSTSTSTISTSASSNPSSSSSSSSMLASTSNHSTGSSSSPTSSAVDQSSSEKTIAAALPKPVLANNQLSQLNALNSARSKQQRKSESDVQIDSVRGQGIQNNLGVKQASNTAGVILLTNDATKNPYFSPILSGPISKNVAFSPTVPVKTNNKKTSGQKVTTPPPQRKNSTGNTSNAIQLNNPQIKAKALAAAKSSAVKQQHQQQQKIECEEDSSTLVDTSSNTMQRSSSHESNLRSKVNCLGTCEQMVPLEVNGTTTGQNSSSKTSLMLDENGSNPTNRRYSEASELSSRCASGQASPNLQSPSHLSSCKVNGIFAGEDSRSYLNPKSPKQTRDHRWTNIYKPSQCDICKKKLFLGIKCKNCKFLKYVRIKNIKKCDVCGRPLWVGIKCKNCKFRCHKDCEKKSPQQCVPPVFLIGVSPSISTTTTATGDSSAGSNASSTMPSPAFVTHYINAPGTSNNSSSNLSTLSSNESTNGSSSARVNGTNSRGFVNILRNIINVENASSGTVPTNTKTIARQPPSGLNLDPQSSNINHLESRSSSSCNSSEPNSPNYFKHFHNQLQHQQQSQQPSLNNPQTTIMDSSSSTVMNKKSSSSSISSASTAGYFTQPPHNNNSSSLQQQQQQQLQPQPSPSLSSHHLHHNFPLASTSSTANTLTPIQSIDASGSVDTNVTMLGANDVYRRNEPDRKNNGNADFQNDNHNVHQDVTGSGGGTGSSGGANDIDFSTRDAVMVNSSQLNYSQDLQQISINYEQITGKEEIGRRGRFGVVYKGYWHGDVAVKEIETNADEDSAEMKNFKEEVFNLRKTRHNNLILFIGACLKPPKCAIVMSLCRSGMTLYDYLHLDVHPAKPASNIDWLIDIATQIAQGMGYLHNKQLIHKDLRSKNVFIDGGKAIITDFGLYSFTKLCNKQRYDLLPVNKESLYYMAPELVRVMGTSKIDSAFSPASDVFSFGTLWYELFSCEFPFSSYSIDTVIYQMGNGLKNLSPNIQIPKEFKMILMKCWSKEPPTRPEFSRLIETFRAIPKRTRLFRSPSHPVHIGRSLEALNNYNNG